MKISNNNNDQKLNVTKVSADVNESYNRCGVSYFRHFPRVRFPSKKHGVDTFLAYMSKTAF